MATWSLVQSKSAAIDTGGGSWSTLTGTLDAAPTSGNLLVFFGWTGYPTTTSLFNSFKCGTQDATTVNTASVNTKLSGGYVVVGSGASTSVSATMNASADNYGRLWVAEFSLSGGTMALPPLDTSIWPAAVSAPGTATDAISTGNVTTALADDLLVACAADNDQAITAAVGTGFTSALGVNHSGDSARVEYQQVATASTLAATFTAGGGAGSDNYFLGAMAFMLSSGTSITPGAGTLSLTGYAPSITAPLDITSGVGVLSLSGLAPTVSVSGASAAPNLITFSTPLIWR